MLAILGLFGLLLGMAVTVVSYAIGSREMFYLGVGVVVISFILIAIGGRPVGDPYADEEEISYRDIYKDLSG